MIEADSLYVEAQDAERESARLARVAREGYRAAAYGGSLDAWLASIRLAVVDGDYERARVCFLEIASRHPGLESSRLVTVAPDVLGPLDLDGDDDGDFPGAGVFTVIAPDARAVAATLQRVSGDLVRVDEHGEIHADEWAGDDVPCYTPNYVFDTEWCQYGAMIALDTKGCMWAAMGRTMVKLIVEAMIADGVVGHLTGARPDLRGEWMNWPDYAARQAP